MGILFEVICWISYFFIFKLFVIYHLILVGSKCCNNFLHSVFTIQMKVLQYSSIFVQKNCIYTLVLLLVMTKVLLVNNAVHDFLYKLFSFLKSFLLLVGGGFWILYFCIILYLNFIVRFVIYTFFIKYILWTFIFFVLFTILQFVLPSLLYICIIFLSNVINTETPQTKLNKQQ